MRAPSAEIDNLTALCGGNNARGFAGDHGLVTQGGEKIGLHDLAFDDGGDDTQHGLTGKYQGALRHGPNVAGKPEGGEVIVKLVANISKDGMMAEIVNFLGVEADIFKKFQALFEARRDQIISVWRQMADEELKRGASIKAGLQIAGRHGELV